MKKKTIVLTVIVMLFICLVIPAKKINNENRRLLNEKKELEIIKNEKNLELAKLTKSVDSLRSKDRIESIAKTMGLDYYEPYKKITRSVK